MPSFAETVCANPARLERRLELPPSWIADPLEITGTLHMRFRAIALSALLSALLWSSFYLAGRALWMRWR